MANTVEVKLTLKGRLREQYKRVSSQIQGQNKRIQQSMKRASNATKSLATSFKGLAIAAGGLIIFHKISQLVSESIRLWGIQEKALAKVEAAIESTGMAAGFTSEEIEKMAGEFQKVTTFGDEVVLRGQAMLLTFTKIGKDVFPLATETMLNMATAMGTDVKESAIQLGKALNDPILGATALRRVGVNLTEQQTAQIKKFTKMGQITKAQKIILDELQIEFGGLARAMAQTDTGKFEQLKNDMGDIQEELGKRLLPAVNEFIEGFGQMLAEGEGMDGIVEKFDQLSLSVRLVGGAIMDVMNFIQGLFRTVAGSITGVVGLVAKAMQEILIIVDKGMGELPPSLVPDGWADGYEDLQASLSETIKNARDGFLEFNEDAEKSFMRTGKFLEVLDEIKNKADETSKKLKTAAPRGGGGGPQGGGAGRAGKLQIEGPPLALFEKRNEEIRSAQERANEAAIQLQENLRMSLLEGRERELAELVSEEEQKAVILLEGGENLITLENNIAKRRSEINARFDEEQMNSAKMVANQQMQASLQVSSTVLGTFAQMSKASKKHFETYKAFAIAQAMVDTYASANASYKAMASIPYVGPALGAIAAAAAIASGLMQVNQIKSQNFNTGGIVGGVGNRDTVPAMLTPGEVVLNRAQQMKLLSGDVGRTEFKPTIIVNGGTSPERTTSLVSETVEEQLMNFSEMQREERARV